MMLDEVRLQQQRFGLTGGHDEIEVTHALQHSGYAAIVIGRPSLAKIGHHPFAQGLGFSHIKDLAVAVAEYVDAGTVRQGIQQPPGAFGCCGFSQCFLIPGFTCSTCLSRLFVPV